MVDKLAAARANGFVERVRSSSGVTVLVDLCSDCGGRPASSARLFRKADPAKFCGCPFDEAHDD